MAKQRLWEARQIRMIAEQTSRYEYSLFREFENTQEYAGICPVCGSWFGASRNDKIFCSRKCYTRHLRPKHKVTCPVCMEVFRATRKGHRFCSTTCRVKSHYRVKSHIAKSKPKYSKYNLAKRT